MKKFIIGMSLLILLVGTTGIYGQDDPFNLQERVSPTTLLFMSFPDLNQALQAFNQTGLGKTLKEGEVQDFLKPVQPYWQQFCDEFKGQIGMDFIDALKIFEGEVSLALVEVNPNNPQMPLSAVLSIQYGSQKAKLDAILKLVEPALPPFQKQEEAGTTIYVCQGAPFCYGFAEGGTLVLATGKELLMSVLHPMADGFLIHAESFIKAQEKVQRGTPAFLFYVNLSEAQQAFGNMLPSQQKELLTSLGIMDITSIALGMNFQGPPRS